MSASAEPETLPIYIPAKIVKRFREVAEVTGIDADEYASGWLEPVFHLSGPLRESIMDEYRFDSPQEAEEIAGRLDAMVARWDEEDAAVKGGGS